MRNRKNTKAKVLMLLLLAIAVGYALLSQTLEINGTSKIRENTWSIIWDNVVVNENSVSGDNVTSAAQITNTEKTLVEYSVTLSKPGDFYEFSVDAKNEGTIDAMINVLSNKVYDGDGTTEKDLPEYLTYYVTYKNGKPIAKNHLLKAGSTETYKVRVEFADVSADKLPSAEETLKFKFSVDYVQANKNAIEPYAKPVSFATDDWETIIDAVQSGDTDKYNVGDTKRIDMGTFGTHTLRIANKSTPEECSTEGFSQTACGFVLEFADIITTYNMNSWHSQVISGEGNVRGWLLSRMRSYVKNDIYNALPTELKDGIIETMVVSGHGSVSWDQTNFTSTDKLYLLSTHEVFEDVDGNTSSGIDYYDTAYNNTRQLDYYKNEGVTTSDYSGAIKQYKESNYYWWLRSAYSYNFTSFYMVNSSGVCRTEYPNHEYGVSPAFRIG